MDKKFDMAKLIGFAGMLLGGAATLISSWSQEKQIERTIEEKVNEALAKRDEEKSEES